METIPQITPAMESHQLILQFVLLTVFALHMSIASALAVFTECTANTLRLVGEFSQTTPMFAQDTENAQLTIIACAIFHILEQTAKTRPMQLVQEFQQNLLLLALIMENAWQTTLATATVDITETTANTRILIIVTESHQQINTFALDMVNAFITIIAFATMAIMITCVNTVAEIRQTQQLHATEFPQILQLFVLATDLA